MKCPNCGSNNTIAMVLEDGPARECLDCHHWGYTDEKPGIGVPGKTFATIAGLYAVVVLVYVLYKLLHPTP